MKKKILLLAVILFSVIGCAAEKGSLSIGVKASNSSPKIKEKVTFTLDVADVKNPEEISGFWYVYNSNKVQLECKNFTGNQFSYAFTGYDTFTVKVVAKNRKDFGTGTTLVTVSQTGGNAIEWSLAEDNNPNSFKAGETVTLQFTKLKEKAGVGAVIDVHLFNEENNNIPFYQNDIKDFIQFSTSAEDKGNYKVVCVVKNANGSRVSLEDQLILMDPNNPIEILIYASKNDKEYEDTVHVSGSVLHQMGSAIVSVELVRTVWYGREEGVYPLSSLKEDGGIRQYKTGDYIAISESYKWNESDLIQYDPETGKFEFTDPMNYYNENGEIEEEGFKWSYAKWDREVWKAILRKQYFSMDRALGISYQIKAASETQPEAPVSSAKVKGYPYISKVALCQILFWYKDAAMNKLWHMQCPRWCWGKTLAWLPKAQNFTGLKSGNISYSVNMGSMSGSGSIQNYSDWEDVMIFTNSNISTGKLALESNKRKEYSGSFTIQTDVYGPFKLEIEKMSVRDMVLQNGLWIKDGASGSVKITRPDGTVDIITAKELESFMPKYDGNSCYPGNGYDKWDTTGLNFDLLKNAGTWTYFNFKYPPLKTPSSAGAYCDTETGNWGRFEGDWEMRYDVSG